MSRHVTAFAMSQGLLTEKKPWQLWEKKQRLAYKRLAESVVTSKRDEPTEVDFSIFTPQKYLFSWATIVGGVEPEKNGYYIKTPHSKFVNDNGNNWFNQVLLESYKSFILAENYLEHIQVSDLSKGKILDAVAWVVKEQDSGEDELLPTVFIDILVATNRKHHALIQKIQSGALRGLSMGCNITHSQCTCCGEIFEEGVDQPCSHITERLLDYFIGKDGKKHRYAESCGVPGRPGSCEFNEASWVGVPAFSSALRHGSLRVGDKWLGKPLRAVVPQRRIRDAARED